MSTGPPNSPAAVLPATAAAGDLGPFVSKARHDLRNCVGEILGFSEMLIEEAQERGHPALIPGCELLTQTARQMVARLNQDLDWPRIQAGHADLAKLRSQLRLDATQVITTTAALLPQAQALPEELFASDLSRIAGVAGDLFRLIHTIFATLLVSRGGQPAPASSPSPGALSAVLPAAVTASSAPLPRKEGHILVVDDLAENRELLSRRLTKLGYSVTLAAHGLEALEAVARATVDLILLDILMPKLDGIETLQRLKTDPAAQHIPVIMLSSSSQIDTVVRCIELGADDFLPKPFNPVLLTARIESSMSKKRLRDQEQAFVKQLQAEQERSERLLLNILPQAIADRLKLGEQVIADNFADASVLFTDFVGFTKISAHLAPKRLVSALNRVFSAFDELCERYGLEKIKTIGDAYMVVGGLPKAREDHAEAVAELALAMQREVAQIPIETGAAFRMRIGINLGPVVAGVIGTKKFAYDLWGDTVNLASRMEAHAPPGGILVTEAAYAGLRDKFNFTTGRVMRIKGRGEMLTYLLQGRKGVDRGNRKAGA